MKKIKYLFGLFAFFICMQGVNASAPSEFTVLHGGEWDKCTTTGTKTCPNNIVGYYKTYAGLQVSWLIAKINDKEQEVFCIENSARAPKAGCKYYKTDYYIDDPAITTIINSGKPNLTYYKPTTEGSYWVGVRTNYHLRKAVLYQYLKNHKNEYLFNDGTVKVTSVVRNPDHFSDSRWSRVTNETGSAAKDLLAAAEASHSKQNDSNLTSSAENSRGKCSEGKYVLSPKITVTGVNVNWNSVVISTSQKADVVNKNVSGNKLTFNIRKDLKDLKSKTAVNVTVSVNSANESSKYYIYKTDANCTDEEGLTEGGIQKVLLSEPDPTVLKTNITVTLDPSVCNVTDYSIDAACTNCYDTGSDASRASYIIQDTDNWEGILRSDDSNYMCDASKVQKKNVASYFTKRDGIYCREEVKIVFPNANDTPTVERGRYFTVHSPFRDEEKIVKIPYSSDYNEDVKILNENKYDHNWGSIKVIKTRECRMKNNENEKSILDKFKNSGDLEFKDTVDIRLTYKGKNEDGASSDDKKELNKYGDKLTTMELEPEPDDEFGSGTSVTSGVEPSYFENADKTVISKYKYVTTQTTTYKLKDGTFRYVLKGDGIYVSEENIKNKDEGTYIDLGISAVPVSSKNKVFTDEDATLSLSFELDSDMHLSKSFVEKNDYLPTCTVNGDKSNIYSYSKKKGTISKTSVSLPNSSKEEKDKVDTIKTSACAKLHMCESTSNGVKNCKLITNDESGSSAGIDSCITNRQNNKMGDGNNNCFTNSQALENGNSNYICAVYVDPGIPSANPINPPDCPGCVCKVSNGVYYGKSGNVISKEEYEKECKVNPGKDGKVSSGSSKIIYRTIDLDNPFPGQIGKNRLTGVNWCSANDNGYITSCMWDKSNAVVNEYILNNRGVNGDTVYTLDPLYEVTLTSDTIDAIRSYNNTHSYDDFTLVCDAKTGENCKSKFVNTYVTRKSGG